VATGQIDLKNVTVTASTIIPCPDRILLVGGRRAKGRLCAIDRSTSLGFDKRFFRGNIEIGTQIFLKLEQ
jgi:hypothetical protein